MSQKVVAQGGKGGDIWDDGVNKGVKKVLVGSDDDARVTFVKFEYVKDSTNVVSHQHGVIHKKPQEFVVNYPKEYITSVEGTYAYPFSCTVITSLVFKTSNGRTSPTFGNKKFVLENNGHKLVGFHGRSGDALDALGAYFLSDSSSPIKFEAQVGPGGSTSPIKVEAQGGPGGSTWDDGVYSNVRKVYVGSDGAFVRRVMFDYVKEDIPKTRAHGKLKEELQEFLLDPKEYITSVVGTYGKVGCFGVPVITSLAFTTSEGRTSLTFGATKFVLEDNGRHLVGFHGRSKSALDAIGAHFALTESS